MGSPVLSCFTPVHQEIGELAIDRLLDQNALHGNAGLPGVAEAAGHAAVGGIGEIGVAVHDRSGVAAKFQRDFFLAGAALDIPATGTLPVKLNQLDALVETRRLASSFESGSTLSPPSGHPAC